MADLDGLKVAKDYHVNTPFANNQGFYVKGANNLDWGMQKHLSNRKLLDWDHRLQWLDDLQKGQIRRSSG